MDQRLFCRVLQLVLHPYHEGLPSASGDRAARLVRRLGPEERVIAVTLLYENPNGIVDEDFSATLRSRLFISGRKAAKPVTVETTQTVRFVKAAP